MYFTPQNCPKIIGIILLSVFLGACGGGTSNLPGDTSATSNVGLPNSPIVENPVAPDSPLPDPIPSDPAPSYPVPSNPTPSSLASRTQGVAPLAVFFDAINVPGVTQPPEVNGRREYANFHYTWNFGDSTSGTWAVSGKSKNKADGYVAAHVFETPGTYTVSLHVTDDAGVDEWHQVDIIVEDPNTIYAGGATICVSATGNFLGCPSGALHVTTTRFSDIAAYLDDRRRILLRRGDSWSTSSQVNLNGMDGLTIGAYGTGTGKDARGIFSNAPVVDVTGSVYLFVASNLTDFRMMDITFTDSGNNGSAVFGMANTGHERHLFTRLKITGFNVPLGYGHWNTAGHDQIALVDNDILRGRTYDAYVGSERLMVMGNRFRDPGQSHVLRVWHAYKGVISHNEQSGSSATSTTGRHALKLHGPGSAKLVNPGVGEDLAHRTQWVIVSDNLIGDSGPWPVAIGPQDAANDENLQDILVENNRIYPGYGTQSASADVQWAIELNARYTTIRNNIITSDGSSSGVFHGVHIWKRGVEWTPIGNRVYNNTFYSPTQKTSGAYGVYTSSEAANTIVQNNLLQFPTSSQRGAVSDNGTNTTESNNLVTTDAGFVDATNATYTSKNFSLVTGSAAIDAGINVPVFTDRAGVARSQGGGYDLGAYER